MLGNSLIFKALNKMSDHLPLLPQPGSFFAGAISGAFGICVSQPFDTIKVRLQNTGGRDLQVLFDLIKYEGFRALWRGMGPSLLAASIGNSISFGVVENCKRILMRNRTEPLVYWEHALCGFWSGVATSFVSTPLEGLRIKMQTQNISCVPSEMYYKNSRDFALEIVKKHGILGLYRGYLTTLIRDSIGDAAFFSTYQTIPKLIFGGNECTEKRNVISMITGGGFAGISFWIFIYPVDTIKSRLQADNILNPKYKGTIDCLIQTVNKSGVRSLYFGFLTCIMRSFPVNIALILGFELAMDFIGRSY